MVSINSPCGTQWSGRRLAGSLDPELRAGGLQPATREAVEGSGRRGTTKAVLETLNSFMSFSKTTPRSVSELS